MGPFYAPDIDNCMLNSTIIRDSIVLRVYRARLKSWKVFHCGFRAIYSLYVNNKIHANICKEEEEEDSKRSNKQNNNPNKIF